MANVIKEKLRRVVISIRNHKLHNKDFTLISDNCWGGLWYGRFGMQYTSPTVGMWIPPKDYIKFLKNMNYYLGCDMERISYKDSHVRDILIERKNSGVYDFELDDLNIGRLDDIDLVLLHYKDFDIAKEKWNRRKRRINFNNMLVKMNDQNGCTLEDYLEFQKLPYDNKLFFTANSEFYKHKDNNVIFCDKFKNNGYVVSDTNKDDVPIDLIKILNNMKRGK